MRPVDNLNELEDNMKVLDKYLDSKTDPEYNFSLNLVKKGTCFVPAKDKGGNFRFYPSRFIGYYSNSMDAQQNNEYRDGRETNEKISEILGDRPISNLEFDIKYKEYCEVLGFKANEKGTFGVVRKFWNVIL